MPLALSTSKLNFCKSSTARTRSSVVVSTRIQAFALILGYPKVLLSTLNFKMQIPDSTGAVQYPGAPGATVVVSLILSSFLVLRRTFVEERLQMRISSELHVEQKCWSGQLGGWGAEGTATREQTELFPLCSDTFSLFSSAPLTHIERICVRYIISNIFSLEFPIHQHVYFLTPVS